MEAKDEDCEAGEPDEVRPRSLILVLQIADPTRSGLTAEMLGPIHLQTGRRGEGDVACEGAAKREALAAGVLQSTVEEARPGHRSRSAGRPDQSHTRSR